MNAKAALIVQKLQDLGTFNLFNFLVGMSEELDVNDVA